MAALPDFTLINLLFVVVVVVKFRHIRLAHRKNAISRPKNVDNRRMNAEASHTKSLIEIPNLQTSIASARQQILMPRIKAASTNFHRASLAVSQRRVRSQNPVDLSPAPNVPDNDGAVAAAAHEQVKQLVEQN